MPSSNSNHEYDANLLLATSAPTKGMLQVSKLSSFHQESLLLSFSVRIRYRPARPQTTQTRRSRSSPTQICFTTYIQTQCRAWNQRTQSRLRKSYIQTRCLSLDGKTRLLPHQEGHHYNHHRHYHYSRRHYWRSGRWNDRRNEWWNDRRNVEK